MMLSPKQLLPISARTLVLAALALNGELVFADPAQAPKTIADSAPVSNGRMIATTPTGQIETVGSLPVNAVIDSSGRYAIITDAGFDESLSAVDLTTGKLSGTLSFPNSRDAIRANGLYYGLAISGNTVYASQGAASRIAVATLGADGNLTARNPILAQANDLIAGLTSDSRGYLYAVNNQYDNTNSDKDPANMATPGSLAIYSEKTGLQVARLPLTGITVSTPLSSFTPTSYPLAVATLTDGSKTFVTSQRDGVVYAIDTVDPTKPSLVTTITVGKDPASVLLSRDQTTLYVANADDDTISIVDTESEKVLHTISLRPAAALGLPGITPLGMSMAPNGKTLYVALGDMNAVGVIDRTTLKVTGLIPAGWYPTAVVCAGAKLLIVDAKGTDPHTPNDPTSLAAIGKKDSYILALLQGKTQLIDTPTSLQLASDTRIAIRRSKLAQIAVHSYGTLNQIGISSDKIEHVIYIVKENRTYDQILGDMTEGNGDASLAIFGKTVTPNQHALAKRFVLLDNFYDSGDVSGDGWNWSTQGYATEYVARNIPYNYSNRGRQYDFEGQNNGYITGGFPALDPDGKPNSLLAPNGAPAIRDVAASSGGHIWDDALASKRTIRNYGFFYSQGVEGVIPDNYPTASGLQPPGHDLKGTSDPDFRRFDLSYPDSNAPSIYYAQTADPNLLRREKVYGHAASPSRYAEWAREFDMMIKADPSGHSVPNLMTIRMMCDHTSGASRGNPTPRSDVADNDCGVGEVVEHISKSPIWNHTAIFVIEDDAQNGEDHVDCHRSTCYVASPYIKMGSVDHNFYNTDSVLRTMEVLLGMKPMCQYDAIAQPIADFTASPLNDAPYDSILPDKSIIAERNPMPDALAPGDPRRKLILASDAMDFKHADDVPSAELNAIVWKTVKGVHSRDPKPQHHMIAQDGSTLDSSSGGKDDDGD